MSRRFGRTTAILLVVAAVVAGLLLLAQDQETLRIQSARGAEEPGHAAYVAALLGADLTAGNQYDVLTNGDQFLPAMLQAIAAARTRIVLETYIYDSGDVAAQFTTALEQAARRGVMCAIVVDAVGSSGMDSGHVQRLESAGCVVATFNPPHWYKLEELNYRSHRKILVVDGEVGFTGGAGIADQFAGHAQDRDHWRETQVRMRGPIVRLLEAAFYENFSEVARPGHPRRRRAIQGHRRQRTFSGDSQLADRRQQRSQAPLPARGGVRTPQPRHHQPVFRDRRIHACGRWRTRSRGASASVCSSKATSPTREPVKYSSRASYDRLLQLGIEIHEYQPTMLHTKALVVDGIYCIVGSANFDNRSFELNDELNIAASSPDLARRLLEDFEGDLKRSKRLTLEAWRQRPMLDKVREHFWSYFGEIF